MAKHSRSVRIVICLALLTALALYTAHLTRTNPKIAEIELAKLIFSGAIVLGIFYTILTYEFNVEKRKAEARTQKSLSTYSALNSWQSDTIINHSQKVREFEKSENYQLLKGDMVIFEAFFDDTSQSELKKSVIAIFNYFETISSGVAEDVLDEGFVKRFFRTVFKLYYDDWVEYIKVRRQTEDSSDLWIEFTNLVEKWHNK